MEIEEKKNETRIIAMNANGYPSNKANKHKIKIFNHLIKDNDILVALETGINENCKPYTISDEHIVAEIAHQQNKGNA